MKLTNEKYNELYRIYGETRTCVSTGPQEAEIVRHLVESTGSTTMLDYGSGKGLQYTRDRVHELMGLKLENISCYDIGIPEFSEMPGGKFDGVICIDVMEHIPEEFVDANLSMIFKKAEKFVFLFIACLPALKTLANGENAHCTVYPPSWWDNKIAEARKDKELELVVYYRVPV